MRIFDAHLHIIDPSHPLVENDGFMPRPFTVADYRDCVSSLAGAGFPVAGGAVVSGSFQAFDQGYLKEALAVLGPSYVGVTQIPADVPDSTVLELHSVGVRAIRFNVARGGSAPLDDMESLARRVHDIAGWHSEFYVDSRRLDDLGDRIAALPAASIDHLGMHSDGLPELLRLVERGVKVKATGFGRVELDPAAVMRAILDVDPSALMVGTDLPSTRAARPFADSDFELIREVLRPDEVDAVFRGNAANFYLGGADAR